MFFLPLRLLARSTSGFRDSAAALRYYHLLIQSQNPRVLWVSLSGHHYIYDLHTLNDDHE